jgi:hypothetical protein
MAVSFSVPSSPSRSITSIDEFLGVDFTNSPGNVDVKKSPNGQNMIRDVPGKVRKCMGYHTIKTYDDRINGYHYRRGDEEALVHTGTNIYLGDELLYEDANDERSKSWQYGDKLYIADGKKLLVYDGETVGPVEDNAYVPTVTIAKAPSGGGTQYEALNLLSEAFQELFAGTSGDTSYYLSFGGLNSTKVEAWKLNSSGDWVAMTEGTNFSVDRTNGIVKFTSAPGVSPVTGEDNVKIKAYRTVEGYADRINHCTIGILYGVSGASDRLFLSGNPDYVNYDWYSQYNDPSYFPDTGYSVLGSSASAIVGYSIINDRLATHKDDMELDRNVILRTGEISDDEAAFKIVNTLQGAGAIAKWSFDYLATEPLFLTRSGIYAVTPQDITGERYSQNRSFFINGKLLEEENLEDAYACTYKDMYWLCLNGVAYILDGLQPIQTDKSMPYATRQYAAFYRINLPARIMWQYKQKLYFGTENGEIKEFYTDSDSTLSYNDDGEAIHAIWETPDLDGTLFYKNKTFRYIAVRLKAAVATSIRMYSFKRGIWSFVKEDSSKGRYLSFSNIVFSKFTFSSDNTQKILSSKLKIKKIDKARFRLENNKLNEPFGIYDLAVEYIENGNYKG